MAKEEKKAHTKTAPVYAVKKQNKAENFIKTNPPLKLLRITMQDNQH